MIYYTNEIPIDDLVFHLVIAGEQYASAGAAEGWQPRQFVGTMDAIVSE